MEQTTEGTISYRLSISRSQRSASSDSPSRGLADVMAREVRAGLTERAGLGAAGGERRDHWIRGTRPASCAHLQKQGRKEKI